jgi:hypothetical protein
MTNLQVKPVAFDKEDESLYGSKEVSVDGKKFVTPIVSMEPKQLTKKDQLAPIAKGLNEIFHISPLKEIIYDIEKQDKFNYRLQTEVNNTDPSKEINLCILEYPDVKYPLRDETEFILDTAFVFSDIVPLPALPKITKLIKNNETKFDNYKIFLEEAIHLLRGNSHNKPILGVIPNLAYGYIADLMEFYIENDINAFYVDFEGRNPLTYRQNLLRVFRKLKQHDMVEDSFLYAHNLNAGRTVKAVDVINAKDILSFGFGFDAMGRKHKPRKLPPTIAKKMIDTSLNRLRLFNKSDYGYYKITNPARIRDLYPEDSSVPLETLSIGLSRDIRRVKRYEKVFNMEQQGLEAFRVRQIVKEYAPIPYLSGKEHVKKEHIKLMKKFKTDATKERPPQKTMFDFYSPL